MPRHYAAARGSYAGEIASAGHDFAASLKQSRLWSVWAFNDILARYRGSILGPIWITLTSAVFVLGVGIVYSNVLKVPPAIYVRWIATGVVFWNFISITLQEASEAFISQGALIRQTSIPLPSFIWRVQLRGIYVFLHQFVVVLVVAIYFHYLLQINLPMAVLGFFLVLANTSWMIFVVAIVSARFRDFQQVVVTLLQLVFFLSPIIWIPSQTTLSRPFLEINPVYHMLDVTRSPMIGEPAHLNSIIYLVVMAFAGWLATFGLYAMTRRRIVHYL